jgi:transcriptional regulator with GAF, ATPase, and Fis domain
MEDHYLTQKPRVYITEARINNSVISLSQKTNLDLSFSQNKVSFHCDGLSFFNEDGVKFEYYLSPIEEKWSNESLNPVITYGYLEPDEYTFYIRAVNQFGVLSDPRTVSFTIHPPFWKRTWFLAVSIFLLIFFGYSFNYYRQRQIRNRNQLLEKIVNEKTRDLEESKAKIEGQYLQLMDAQKELVEKRELEKAHSEIKLLQERLAKENIYLREKQGIIQEAGSIIGRSSAIQEVRKKVVEIAGTNSTVLITGMTGVGKNLVAEAIHDLSSRKDRALITVNCAAIPDSLVESELFGHEKGAFTGAVEKQEGKFEMADGSTVFLDEIGDMPLSVQAKLLNVLQSRKFMRIGGSQEINVDVRIIAATNQNIAELVEAGKFRRDLYYRINVYSIDIPPLKERIDDIEPIAKYFIGRFSMLMNKKITAITKSALKILQNYSYPGNIRELENIIHRAVIICKGDTITDEDILISPVLQQLHKKEIGDGEFLSLEELERQYITKVLEKTNWKIRGEGGAADILKIDPGTLRSRMKKFGIPFLNQKN